MANNVAKVIEQGWAGRRNMAARHLIPQRIHIGQTSTDDDGAEVENIDK